MTSIVLASNNGHKYREMAGILDHLGAAVELLRPHDLGITFDVRENGTTFGENAATKGWGLYNLFLGIQLPEVTVSIPPEEVRRIISDRFGPVLPWVIADDSGICVHALDNGPGIYSARFGADRETPPRNDTERNHLLLETLRGEPDRGAHYVCNAVLIMDREQYIQAEAPWHGTVLDEEIPGDTCFGYDPVIYLPEYGTSVARIPQQQKDLISHRAKAVGAVIAGAGLS
jgi:XTP/dITP diphosphohydrolase